MLQRALPWILFVLSTSVLGGVVWWQQQRLEAAVAEGDRPAPEARRAPAEEAALRDRIRSLEFELMAARNLAAEAEVEGVALDRARLPVGPEARSAEPEAAARGPGAGEGERRPGWERFLRRIQENPEAAALFQAEIRGRTEARYADFLRGLSPAQASTALGLLSSRDAIRATANAQARAAGIDPRDNAAMAEFTRKTLEPVESALRSSLGESGWQTLQEYERFQPYRNQVNTLERRLSYSGAPLQEYQVQPLLRVLSEQPPAPSRPGRGSGEEQWAQYFAAQEAANERLLQTARTVLSGPQLENLEAMRREQLQQQQLRYQLLRQQSPPTAGPTPVAARPTG